MTNVDIIWTINREYRIVELFRGRSRAPTGRPPAVISSGTGINSSPASCKVYRNFGETSSPGACTVDPHPREGFRQTEERLHRPIVEFLKGIDKLIIVWIIK